MRPMTRATPTASPVTDLPVIHRTLAVALIAGLVAGLAVAVLQHFTTTPLIAAAEVFEAAQHAHMAAQEVDEGWKPAEGAQRALATAVATIAVATGYALVLLAALLVTGDKIEPKRALIFAACGFAATGLATGLGLAPQLPGAAEADLGARQIWWIATALAAAGGLFLLLRRPEALAKLAGFALIVTPHLVGAPQPKAFESTAPAELAARFAASSLAAQAVTWCLAGALVGLLWRRFSAREIEP
jgi:cobalt transporter subunit CbtA